MIALGGTTITKAYLGSTELANIAIGDELLLSSEPAPLPEGVVEIEYLEKESGKNSLIDLGTREDAIFEITAQATGTVNTSMVLISRNSASSGGSWFGVASNGKWGFGTGSGAYSNVSALDKTDMTVDFTVNPVVGTINGNTFSRAKGGPNSNWILFGSLYNNYPFIGRLYSLKAYIVGKLVFDLIPCRVGNVGYLYDKISKNLFANVNSDPFLLGTDKTI